MDCITATGVASTVQSLDTGCQRITDLLPHVLELILIQTTSNEEKKSLRQTCKCFQQILDANLRSTDLWMIHAKDDVQLKRFLQRIRNARLFNKLIVRYGRVMCSLETLLKQLPEQLTALTIEGNVWKGTGFKELGRLRCLKSLNILGQLDVTGLGDAIGITRLLVARPLGSLASLAPTLKQLKMHESETVQDLDQLTNLEDLDMLDGLPRTFFKTHDRLPLKHIALGGTSWRNAECLSNATEWHAAPKTLSRLTLHRSAYNIQPGVLPASITCMSLYDLDLPTVERAMAAQQSITRLEVDLHVLTGSSYADALQGLSNLTGLQNLRLCITDRDGAWTRKQILSALPYVTKAVERSVKLEAANTNQKLHTEVFFRSTWGIPS